MTATLMDSSLTLGVLQAQLGALMGILKEHIAHMEKDLIIVHQSELTSFFLTALDFRAEHCQVCVETFKK